MSYGFTKSFAVPFSCKFQPAFNTSPTVAALLGLMYLSPSLFVVFGAAASVFGVVVSFLAPSKLPATFVIALPPLFKPSFVTDTGCFVVSAGVIVTPSLLITVLSPASFLNSALVKPVNSVFKE